MPRRPPPGKAPLLLPFAQWPEIDRRLWHQGCDAGDGLDDPSYVADRRPQTIVNARKGWGRFLAVLTGLGLLDPSLPPSARVTRPAVVQFITALRDAGNAGSTLAARLFELRAALKVMEPDMESAFSWLVRPGRGCAWPILGSPPRVFKVFHSLDLLEWGLRRMDAVAIDPASPANRATYRNGLNIALFAARGLRIGSMAALRLGSNLIRCDTGWRLELAEAEMKNQRHLGYELSDRLTPYLNRYIDEVRPAFGIDRRHGPVWVVEGGGPFRRQGIDSMIRRASRELTTEGFSSHTFRRSVGTTAPLASPNQPAAAAALLGVSQGVAERHYNLGQTAQAAEQYHAALRKFRENVEK